jgi:hypothetical protein
MQQIPYVRFVCDTKEIFVIYQDIGETKRLHSDFRLPKAGDFVRFTPLNRTFKVNYITFTYDEYDSFADRILVDLKEII